MENQIVRFLFGKTVTVKPDVNEENIEECITNVYNEYKDRIESNKDMNKYYTPSIEEFHIGFEYESEEDPIQGKWEKQKVNDYRDLINCMNYYGRDSDVDTRVKYLDREDLFDVFTNSIITINKDDFIELQLVKNDEIYYKISYEILNQSLSIDKYWLSKLSEEKYESRTIFEGLIKNKSQLIILKTQLCLN
jgi:hypothetical protein